MKRNIVLVSINFENEYSLAIHYLRYYALENSFIRERAELIPREFTVKEPVESIAEAVLAEDPAMVAFSCNIWSIAKTEAVAQRIKTGANPVIVFGGQEVTNSSIDYAAKPYVDIVVDGEGEETFTEIVTDFLKTGLANKHRIAGIIYSEHGSTVKTEKRRPLPDLDEIPSPYLKDGVHLKTTHHFGAMIETMRGCPHHCTFCFESEKYGRVRFFSFERIEAEMRFLLKKGVRRFHFLDPVMASGLTKRLEQYDALLSQLQEEYGRLFIPIEVYADRINEKNFHYFQNYSNFDVGLQSINPKVHHNINRDFDIDTFRRGYDLLKTLNKEISMYLILGLPGESYDSFVDSVRFSVRITPTFIHMNTMYLLNGIPMRRDVERFHIGFDPDPPYEVLSTETLPEEQMSIAKVFSKNASRTYNLNRSVYNKHIDDVDDGRKKK